MFNISCGKIKNNLINIKKMNTELIDKYENEMIKRPSQIREVLKEFGKELQEQQLILNGVGRSKRESNFKLFNEINSDFLQAMIDNDQGIYDPVEEFKQNLEDKYIIIKK